MEKDKKKELADDFKAQLAEQTERKQQLPRFVEGVDGVLYYGIPVHGSAIEWAQKNLGKAVKVDTKSIIDPGFDDDDNGIVGLGPEQGMMRVEIYYDRDGIDFLDYYYEADDRLEQRNIAFLTSAFLKHMILIDDEPDEDKDVDN